MRPIDPRDIPESEKPSPLLPPCPLYERIVRWFGGRRVAEEDGRGGPGRSPSA